MFTWLNKQGVESDRGFSVQRTDRFAAEYREGDCVITVRVESGLHNGAPCIIVGPHAFQRWDGNSSFAELSMEKQDEILANFTEAMEFQGLQVVVE